MAHSQSQANISSSKQLTWLGDSGVTTLAWDIATLFKAEFPFIKEKVLHWGGGYGYGYDHSYMPHFQKGWLTNIAADRRAWSRFAL